MNAPLRRTGVVVLVLFALLFLNLNYVQAYKADDYRTSRYNARVQVDEYTHPRGKISLSNTVVADSKETTNNLKFLRTYPFGPLYAQIVGYHPVNLGSTELERLENDFLTGNADIQAGERLTALFTGKRASGGIVQLTLSQAAQQTAYTELLRNNKHSTKGAVVALDPTTGAVLASVSIPSYDPNALVLHDTTKAQANYKALNTNPDRPLANRALSETYPPGSVFKVIVSAAAIADAGLTKDSVVPGGNTYLPPQTTKPIKNVTGEECPDQLTLADALRISCNTAFAQLGVQTVHADKLKAMAQAFGFETEPHFIDDDKNIMGTVASHTGNITAPDGAVDQAALAQSSIGQFDVRISPLQGAMIAATVANDGREMRPYVVERLQSADLSTVQETIRKQQGQPIDNNVAGQLQDMMEGVVQNGTGTNAQVSGLRVGGKTGTAQNAPNTPEHGWFIGWAMRDNKPLIAVAVVLENAGNGGSAEAARIAGLVMKAYANENGGK